MASLILGSPEMLINTGNNANSTSGRLIPRPTVSMEHGAQKIMPSNRIKLVRSLFCNGMNIPLKYSCAFTSRGCLRLIHCGNYAFHRVLRKIVMAGMDMFAVYLFCIQYEWMIL